MQTTQLPIRALRSLPLLSNTGLSLLLSIIRLRSTMMTTSNASTRTSNLLISHQWMETWLSTISVKDTKPISHLIIMDSSSGNMETTKIRAIITILTQSYMKTDLRYRVLVKDTSTMMGCTKSLLLTPMVQVMASISSNKTTIITMHRNQGRMQCHIGAWLRLKILTLEKDSTKKTKRNCTNLQSWQGQSLQMSISSLRLILGANSTRRNSIEYFCFGW